MYLTKKTCGATLNDIGLQERVSDSFNSLMATVAGAAAAIPAVMSVAFATGVEGAMSNVESGITTGLGQAWSLLKAIALPIAAIIAVICAFHIFVGGEKGMEKAKKIALYLIIGLAVVYLGPLLVETVAGWFSDAGANSIFTTS